MLLRSALAACVLVSAGCGADDVGVHADPVVEDPSSFTLTLDEAEARIAEDTGDCLRLRSYVPCDGGSCAPLYRLDPIAKGAVVDGCARTTFVVGKSVHSLVAPDGAPFAWTCLGGGAGGSWTEPGGQVGQGAIVCRP